jgi:H+/Cl- antiporter ClcA
MRGRGHESRRHRGDENRDAPRLSKRYRRATYAIAAGVWLTGVLWLVAHYFFRHEGEFGIEPSASESWWLRLHGAFAFVSLWAAGLVWALHARHGITRRKRRPTGLVLIGVFVALAVSGYLLYYASGDGARDVVRLLHWSFGLAVAVPFLIHALSARAARLAARQSERPGGRQDFQHTKAVDGPP